MVKLSSFVIETKRYNDFINITKEVEKHVAESGVKNGVVFVITGHHHRDYRKRELRMSAERHAGLDAPSGAGGCPLHSC